MMKFRDELVGKNVIDESGDKVGEVEDIEVDLMKRRINGIILKEGGISSKLGLGEERMVSMDMIEAIGDEIRLRKLGRTM
ncbi:PRC-barrel domain-containing protein [Methanobacterium sp.]|uniref:PRC-barrel domain-containing protein n=2 Tax=unclassified Methanobacterium TaxID=2627676 RepID=UPI003D65F769